MRVGRGGDVERAGGVGAVSIDAPEHGIGEPAGPHSVPLLGELDGLGDRRVGGDAFHEQELVDAQAQEVDDVGIQSG